MADTSPYADGPRCGRAGCPRRENHSHPAAARSEAAALRAGVETVMVRHWHADDCAAWGRPPRPLTASCTCWKADLRAAIAEHSTPEQHAPVPGVDQDDPKHPDPRWCNVCGEPASAPQHATPNGDEAEREMVDATLEEIRRMVSGEFGEPPAGEVVPADAYVAHVRTVAAALDIAQDQVDRALAVLNGAPIPMGEVRARHAAAILRGDRG